MAQAAKQLKKIKDIEAQALQEQKEKEESNRKRRNRSRDRKKKVRGRRRRPRTEAPGVAAGRRSIGCSGADPPRAPWGWRAGHGAGGRAAGACWPGESLQHLEQRPAGRRAWEELLPPLGWRTGKGLHRGVFVLAAWLSWGAALGDRDRRSRGGTARSCSGDQLVLLRRTERAFSPDLLGRPGRLPFLTLWVRGGI